MLFRFLNLNFKNMLNITKNFEWITSSNLVILLRSRVDFDKYEFLNLDKKILSKIEEIFNEQKNVVKKFFLAREDFEEVIFLFHLDNQKDLYLFLWENISSLPDKITFEYSRDNILLDSIVLWKYDYDNYKSEKKELDLNIICPEMFMSLLEERFYTLKNITDCRDLVNKPSCDKTPDKYLEIIKWIKFNNTKVKVIGYDEVKKLWLNLLDAVWKWSSSKPKLVILERIVDKKAKTIWLVWKWITFDTGWLNIKVENYMMNMKDDMAWSAALLYTMKELDEKDINFNIVCALAIAENSVSWDSYRPGDIIKWYGWKSVEIMNTDAEGRLVLADGVSYISKNYELESITTVATLTWACMVALGYNYAWIMWYNRELMDTILKNETFENYWELPFNEFYIEKTKWTISDLKNLSEWYYAWSTFGWAFLYNFCLNKEKFTHIDIAWVSFVKEKYWLYNVWATGFWVDSLSKSLLKYGEVS